jgi:hypothetical protein
MTFYFSKNSTGFRCMITGQQYATEVEGRQGQAHTVDQMIKFGYIGVNDLDDVRNLQNAWGRLQELVKSGQDRRTGVAD